MTISLPIEGGGGFEIARHIFAGIAHRIFGFEEFFKVFAFNVMASSQTRDADVELHFRQSQRYNASSKTRCFLLETGVVDAVEMSIHIREVFLRRSAAVDRFVAELVPADVV